MSIDPKLVLLPLKTSKKKKTCVISLNICCNFKRRLNFWEHFSNKSNPCHVHGLLGKWVKGRKRAWKTRVRSSFFPFCLPLFRFFWEPRPRCARHSTQRKPLQLLATSVTQTEDSHKVLAMQLSSSVPWTSYEEPMFLIPRPFFGQEKEM